MRLLLVLAALCVALYGMKLLYAFNQELFWIVACFTIARLLVALSTLDD